MSTVNAILKLIAARPGIVTAEVADELEIDSGIVSTLVRTSVNSGLVRVETRKTPLNRDTNAYFPSQQLLDEAADLPIQMIRRARAASAAERSDFDVGSDFSAAFSSNGALSITKNRKVIELSDAETTKLLAFIDSINIERIMGGAR